MWPLPDSDPFCVSSGAKIFATTESQFNNVTMNTPLNPNKALWEKGDFARIADTMRESGEALVRQLGITKGLRVLDLGCGDGTTAIPAAKLGADVLGVDIARNLVEAGNKRAGELGLTNWRVLAGGARDMEKVPDHEIDLTASNFDAVYTLKSYV